MLLRTLLGLFLYIFLNIRNISCENGSTLAFAIDDTRSMWDDIDQVKKEAHNIMKVVLTEKSSEIKDFVLVTINDPDVVLQTKTKSTFTFQRYLNNIRVHNFANVDCEEMSMTGIEKALLASRPDSYIYVFTDASAKDYYKASYVKSLCQKKQSQVVFVLTGDCRDPSSRMFMVYHEIAAACGGQVFNVRKDQVDSVLQTIKILLKGKNPAIKWTTVPKSFSFLPVSFTIDEKVDYAMVSTSGKDVVLRISTVNHPLGPEPRIEKIMWNENGKVVRLIDPIPGTYYAWVKGNSSVSVMVYARTDFTFEHGFSTLKPKSMKDTAKRPIAGAKQHLSIKVTDPEQSVNIELVQILDLNNDEYIIMELPLKKTDENFYITDPFISPSQMFKIAVKGETKITRKSIRRISKTAVEPAIPIVVIPETLPNVKIDEGVNVDVSYGADVTLTCRVSAHPAPNIEWFTSSNGLLLSENSLIEDTSYISYLKLRNIKQNGTYVCKASNKRGTMESQIRVGVRPVFRQLHIAATISAKYKEDVKIICGIKSYLPIRVRWFLSEHELSNSRVYSISEDGSALTVKSMDLGMEGKYTCEVSLNSDHTVNQSHSKDVKITGLVGPEITYSTTVLNKQNFSAICRVKGVPKPTILWQFKPNGSKVFTTIPGSGEELNIPELKLKHSGVYKCVVRNQLGETHHDFDVVAKEPPTITNDRTTYFGVQGDLYMKIPCNVTGFPEPDVIWKMDGNDIEKESKYVIKGNDLYIKCPMMSDSKNFSCEARNELGVSWMNFDTEVVDFFQNDETFYGDTHEIFIEQGESVAIECKIISSDTRSVRWYRNGEKTNQTGNAYIIDKASVSDDGNYTCRVDTIEGSIPENYLLDVGFPPVFYDDSSSLVDISWVDDEILDCKAPSKPEAKFEWLHNGKNMEKQNGETIHISDWGEYTCRVSNVHGIIQKTFNITTPGCYLTNNMGTQNKPLISDIKSQTWPFLMSSSDILLKENEEIKLSCPNKSSNAFQMILSKTEIIAKCNAEDKFFVDGKIYRYPDLQCNKKVEPLVINKHELCLGPNSEMIRVGFQLVDFLNIYEICFDKKLNVPLYGSAPIPLATAKSGAQPSEFKWTPDLEVSDGKPTGGYTCETSNTCCYAKNQLVNYNDLPFGPAQDAMFKENLNSISVWIPCAGSGRMSWQKFENEIRDLSEIYSTWSSWTGASDYVPKNGGLVPRYLWKLMRYEGSSSVMVYVNDEFPVPSDVRCPKTCTSFVESSDKYLYCCTLEEFSRGFGISIDKLI